MPLIGFDECFFAVAIGIDLNNSQYCNWFAVMEKENTSTRTWFMGLLREDLGA